MCSVCFSFRLGQGISLKVTLFDATPQGMVATILWKTILIGWVLNPRKEHDRKITLILECISLIYWYVGVCSTLSIIPWKSKWFRFSLVKWGTPHTETETKLTNPPYSCSTKDIFWTLGDATEASRNFRVGKFLHKENKKKHAFFFFKHRKLLPD